MTNVLSSLVRQSRSRVVRSERIQEFCGRQIPAVLDVVVNQIRRGVLPSVLASNPDFRRSEPHVAPCVLHWVSEHLKREEQALMEPARDIHGSQAQIEDTL